MHAHARACGSVWVVSRQQIKRAAQEGIGMQHQQSITIIIHKEGLHTHGLCVVKPGIQEHHRHAAAMQVPHPGVRQAALVGWVAELGEVDARDATAPGAAAPCTHVDKACWRHGVIRFQG